MVDMKKHLNTIINQALLILVHMNYLDDDGVKKIKKFILSEIKDYMRFNR